MTRRALAAALLLAVPHGAARAEPPDRYTGRIMDVGCAQAAKTDDTFLAGMCFGTVRTLMIAEAARHPYGFCIAPGTQVLEPVARIQQFMDAHADRMNQPFIGLAIDALREAYPCGK